MTTREMLMSFTAACVCLPCLLLAAEVADKAVPADPGQVGLTGWLGQRVEVNLTNRLLTVSLDERLRPYKNPAGGSDWSGEHIGKWLHASCLMWRYSQDAALRKRLDEAARTLIACQGPDGYLGTYAKDRRWGGWDVWAHKYNLIGLLSYHDTTGDKPALDAARKIGDLLIETFGEGKRDIVKAGQHIGMAATSVLEPMVLLYRATGEQRYLDFAHYIVSSYDRGPKIVASLLSKGSVGKMPSGKAYEMMSNLVGLCELYRTTGDEKLLKACQSAYDDIVANQLYVTGGLSLNESFYWPPQLPNTGHISENCAQVTWMQLCLQLLRLTGQARYADTLEQVTYNHLLASQKPSGEALCYYNPLEGRKPYSGRTDCCTSSGPRGIALLTTFAYMTAPKVVIVNFYEPSTFLVSIEGVKTKITQKTKYPVEGGVEILIEPEKPVTFDLRLRVPGWCTSGTLNTKPVEGEAPPPVRLDASTSKSYASVSRTWKAGDRIEIAFDMPAVLVKGAGNNEGRLALTRGPLVLALDSALNPGMTLGRITPAAGPDGSFKLTPAQAANDAVAHAFAGEALMAAVENGRLVARKAQVLWTSFAEAGGTGSSYTVWMRSPEQVRNALASPFLFGKESSSQRGNETGSIADDDPATWQATYNGKKQEEAWFAVEVAEPMEINEVVYVHGRFYHDGGWFDASKSKPQIQVKSVANGPWEDVARIDGYPDTTTSDNKGLPDNKEFAVTFAMRKVVAIRVLGAPACGDKPGQNSASCSELRGVILHPVANR